MKVVIGLYLIAMAALAVAYSDVNDNENIEAIVNSAEMKDHIGCYLNKIPCTDQTLRYKNHMSEAVSDGCHECNDKERHLYKVFLKAMKDHYPDDYKQYQKIYDPTATHFAKLMADLEKY